MKKVFFKSTSELNNFENLKGEKTLLILPQESSINYTIRDFLKNNIDIRNTEFETFDNIIKKYRKLSSPDSVTKFIVLGKILKKNLKDVKVYPDTVDIVLDFFNNLIENYINSDTLSNFNSKVVSSLSNSYDEYKNYFKKRNLRLDSGIDSINAEEIKFDRIIISGFIRFRKSEFKLIEKLSKSKDIYIDMPFNFIKSDLLDETLGKLKDMDFEVICKDYKDYRDDIKSKDVEIISTDDNIYNLFFTKVKKILENNSYNDLKILSSSRSLSKKIKNREYFEGVEFNFKESETPILRDEFLRLLDYFLEKDRSKTISRLRLKYFNVKADIDAAEKIMLSYNFSNLEDIDFSKVIGFEGSEEDFTKFYDAVTFMQSEKIEKSETLDYYTDFFINYLNLAYEKIVDEVKENPDTPALRDMLFAKKLTEILENMKNLKNFYSEISLSEYILLLKKYIEDAKVDKVTNLEAIEMSSLNANYYRVFKNLILIGLDHNFEKSKKNNFIYNRETEKFMNEIGLLRDSFREEYITLIYAILNSKKALILTEDEELGYSKVLYSLINNAGLKVKKHVKEYNTSGLEIDYKRDENNYDLRGLEFNNINSKIKNRTYSVTDFDILKDCPRRFLFERVFRLEEIAKEYDEKFYIKTGEKYHRILEKYFKREKSFSERTLKLIILDDVGNGRKYSELTFFEKIDVRNTYEILKEYILTDLKEQDKDKLYPKYFEKSFDINIDGKKIRGRIDRIDANGDVEGLVDYKRSSGKTLKSIIELKSFQMPIYAMSRKSEGKSIAKASYGNIRKADISKVIKNEDYLEKEKGKKSYFTSEDLDELLNNYKMEINRLVEEVENGNFLSESKCINCSYTDICKNLGAEVSNG